MTFSPILGCVAGEQYGGNTGSANLSNYRIRHISCYVNFDLSISLKMGSGVGFEVQYCDYLPKSNYNMVSSLAAPSSVDDGWIGLFR